jgi:hypothetical protein
MEDNKYTGEDLTDVHEDPFIQKAEEYINQMSEESGFNCDVAVVVPDWEGSVVIHMSANETKEGKLELCIKEIQRLRIRFALSGFDVKPSTESTVVLNRAVSSFVRTAIMQDEIGAAHKVHMVLVSISPPSSTKHKHNREHQLLQGLLVANLEAHKPHRFVTTRFDHQAKMNEPLPAKFFGREADEDVRLALTQAHLHFKEHVPELDVVWV